MKFMRALRLREHANRPSPLRSRRDFRRGRPYYYLGGNRALTELSNGLPFFVNTDDRFISPWIIRVGCWENFVDDVLMRLAEPGMRVCDIGANMGYYTIKLADRVGADGHVLAIEPSDVVHRFLADNITINAFMDRVRAPRVAVGSAPGTTTLHYASANLGSGNLFGMAADCDPRSEIVEMTTVDLLNAGQPGFDIIKIDVEGWETEVLRGMRETLARSPHASIVTEVSWNTWSHFGDPRETLHEFIGPRDGVFMIQPSGRLRRLSAGDIAGLDPSRQFYALFTPWERTRQRLEKLVE